MRARPLRTILLVKAIEENDPAGEVLPLADRGEATLRALRGSAPSELGRGSANALSRPAETMLARRAADLSQRLGVRFPIVRLLARSSSAFGPGRAALVLAILFGAALSMLDGSRRIDILAFPLLGVILWNLMVYVALTVGALRGRATAAQDSTFFATLYRRWVQWRASSRLKDAATFNAPLSRALQVFSAEWLLVARPLMARRARTLMHLAAAAVAIGLVGGLYLKGIVLQYQAGWESTFLTPSQVHRLMRIVFGPASMLSGVPLPADAATVEALRWGGTARVPAAPWIHLIALTAALYVIAPRLLLAIGSGAVSFFAARRLAVPPALISYGRNVLGGIGAPVGEGIVRVTPYAYTPGAESGRGLHRVLTAALGGGVRLDLTDEVRFGEEDFFFRRLAEGITGNGDFEVLVMNLAATPERENHGTIIEAVRDKRQRLAGATPLLVIVDETSYASRLMTDPSLQSRLAERRDAWSSFVTAYGVGICCINLGQQAAAIDPAQAACIRATLLAQT